jgi:hypothetical protein
MSSAGSNGSKSYKRGKSMVHRSRKYRKNSGEEVFHKNFKRPLTATSRNLPEKGHGFSKKSGVEEIFSERDNLLQEISDLCKEFKKSRRPKVNKVEQIVNLGKQVRDEQALLFSTELQEENSVNKNEQFSFVAEVPIVQMHEEAVEMEITQDRQENINIGNEQNGNLLDQVEETPSVSARKILMPKRKRYNKSRPLRQNAMQYLSEKNGRELQLKLTELELQERKVRLEERRLEFEIEEQRKRADLENSRMQLALDQQQNKHDLIKNQQKIIEALISRL